MKRHAALLALAVLLYSCSGAPSVQQAVVRHFSTPSAPSMIQSAEEASKWLSVHFWEKLADSSASWLCDSSHVAGIELAEVEQAFSNFAMLLDRLEPGVASRCCNRLCDQMEAAERRDSSSNVLEQLAALAEKYLYDPNSPLRNEDLYSVVADRLSGWDGFDEAKRTVYADQARRSSLNSTGSIAADFAFSDRRGRVYTLHGIKAELVLLFFSNPGCEACKEIINTLRSSDKVCSLIASKRLAVANIYIDEDTHSWYSYMPEYPEDWLNGYDHNLAIRTGMLYDVRAIPSVYVLDKEKRVVLKDATLDKTMNWLQNFENR